MDRLFFPRLPSRTISYPPFRSHLVFFYHQEERRGEERRGEERRGEESGPPLFPVSLPIPLVTPPFDLTWFFFFFFFFCPSFYGDFWCLLM